jgi:hypothetical protein
MILLGLLIAAPAFAQLPADDDRTSGRNEAVTSSGLPPVVYTRTPELQTQLLAAAAQIHPINGKITTVLLGNSGAKKIGVPWQAMIKNGGLYAGLRASDFDAWNFASNGKTAKEWANPNDPAWTGAMGYINAYPHADTVQHVHFILNTANPSVNGSISTAQLDGIITATRYHLPNVRIVTWSTGNPPHQAVGPLSTMTAVHDDDALLAASVGVKTNGIVVEYLPLYSDGINYNLSTVSPAFPLGLNWVTADTDLVPLSTSDGLHPGAIGSDKGARSIWDRWRYDPVFSFMWNDGGATPPPPPPPPDPPVVAPLQGAEVELYAGICSVVSGGLRATVPAIWCAGLVP